MTRGHDGDAMPPMPGPMGSGQPIMELPLGEIGMEALAPTVIVMQNLPAIASLASSLVAFLLEKELTGELTAWMFDAMCDKHQSELPLSEVPVMLRAYKKVIDKYLVSLGMTDVDGCSHD